MFFKILSGPTSRKLGFEGFSAHIRRLLISLFFNGIASFDSVVASLNKASAVPFYIIVAYWFVYNLLTQLCLFNNSTRFISTHRFYSALWFFYYVRLQICSTRLVYSINRVSFQIYFNFGSLIHVSNLIQI